MSEMFFMERQRQQVLAEQLKRQERTDKAINEICDIFESKNLNLTRRGKLALAEVCSGIIIARSRIGNEQIVSALGEEEAARLSVNGISLLQKGGMSGPLSPLAVMMQGRDMTLCDMANEAAELVNKSRAMSEEDKMLVKYAARQFTYGKDIKIMGDAIRSLRIQNALLPTIRRGKAEEQKIQIGDAVREFFEKSPDILDDLKACAKEDKSKAVQEE
jgi:hypothetical protein